MSEMVVRVARALRGMEWAGVGREEPPNVHDDAEAIVRTAIEAMEAGLRSLLNGEHSSLSLSLNELNGPNYQTVEEWLRDEPQDDADWVNAEEREKAIRTNSVWRLQWYPDTPVGFQAVQASSLSELFGALPSPRK